MQFVQDGIRYSSVNSDKVKVDGFALGINPININIPHYIKGYMVVGISPLAFAENQTLTNISIPDTVCFIGEKAFYKCISLKTVSMNTLDERCLEFEQGKVLSICEKVFSGCRNLSKFTMTKSIELKGVSVFKNCSMLTKINGNICGNLPDKSFFNCFSLSEFHFNNPEMTIGLNCFSGCPNIKDFYIETDLELSIDFLNTYKDSKFHCNPNSKYLNLAYRGYHVEKILPKV